LKELKSGEKIVQQMTRDGAVEINKATGGAESISARNPDISPVPGIIGGVADRVLTERRIMRKKAVRKANRKIFESAQRKPETSRLNFTDAERKNPAMSKAIQKSDRAADRYEKARAYIPRKKVSAVERVQKKPDGKPQSPQNQQGQNNILNNKAAAGRVSEKPGTRLVFRERDSPLNGKFTHALERPGREAASLLHREVGKREDDNSGVQAAHFSEKTAENAAGRISAGYSRLRFEPQRQLFKAEEQAVKANANALYERSLRQNPELAKANPAQKALHKRKIKREYAKAFRQGNIGEAGKKAQKAKKAAKKAGEEAKKNVKAIVKNRKLLAIIGGILGLIILFSAGVSSCMSMFGGGFNAVIGTSYTAEDEDILGADADYTILQNELAANIYNIPSVYPGYDEYNFSLDEIMHDPFGLASYLTAKYNAYTQAGVQAELAYILSQQYTLTLTPVTEIRQRVEIHTEIHTGTYIDDDGEEVEYEYEVDVEVEVEYEYYILNISLVNNAVGSVALSSLTPEQYEMYLVYMETKGNKPELFP